MRVLLATKLHYIQSKSMGLNYIIFHNLHNVIELHYIQSKSMGLKKSNDDVMFFYAFGVSVFRR